MTIFVIGLIIFFGVHILPLTPLRDRLHASLGENPYKGLFSLVSLIGLGLILWGFSMLRSGPAAFPIYWPPEWTKSVTGIMVLVAFICLVAAYTKGRLKTWLKHPMSIGIALWSVGHLMSNGRQAAVILFACFLAYAVIDIVVNLARGKGPTHEPRLSGDIIAVIGGIVAYGLFAWLHQYMVGIPLF